MANWWSSIDSSGNINFYPYEALEEKCKDVVAESIQRISEIEKIYHS
jgi:hypothetical protein